VIDGLLICLFLLAVHPFCKRDGELVAWLLTIYPLTRCLIEVLRDDEPGMFNLLGFSLTIAQTISLLILVAAAALWVYVRRRPPGRAFDRPPAEGPWAWTLAGSS
jgi:phosphatidylglycerol:prolipoprotein diacylglycerol transferase